MLPAGVFGASAAARRRPRVLWGALAPRVLVQVVSKGTAEIVHAETSAFIVADVWFCLIGVAGGLLTGCWATCSRSGAAGRPRRRA